MDTTAEGAAHGRAADGAAQVTCDLPHDDADRAGTVPGRAALRERSADVASLRHVFQPASVAVAGPAAAWEPWAGSSCTENHRWVIRARRYANLHARTWSAALRAHPVAALLQPVDLAVVAVSLVVVDTVPKNAAARNQGPCRHHGGGDAERARTCWPAAAATACARLGPGCFGIGVPSTGLGVDLCRLAPGTGTVGLANVLVGFGVALVDRRSRLGVGVLASVAQHKRRTPATTCRRGWRMKMPDETVVLNTESSATS